MTNKEVDALFNSLRKGIGDDLFLGTIPVKRWDTGIYALNKAIGGGIPAGRFTLLVGKESTGKSTIAAKLGGIVSSMNYETGELCESGAADACRVLYIDAEGTLDEEWCAHHNYYPDEDNGAENGNRIMSTTTGNQTVDAVTTVINSGLYSLIILDSIEALVPYKDLEKSSEDFKTGTKAKMNNEAFRVWQVALTEANHPIPEDKWWQRTTVLCINQLREAISTVPAPPVIPGGRGQVQAASIVIQMNSPKYTDANKLGALGTFKGVTRKNKTFQPKVPFEYDMLLKSDGVFEIGTVDNIRSIIQDVRRFGIWEKKEDGLWHLFDYTASKQSEFEEKMRSEPEVELDIMTKVIQYLKDN